MTSPTETKTPARIAAALILATLGLALGACGSLDEDVTPTTHAQTRSGSITR